MRSNIKVILQKTLPDIIQIRRQIHAHPELAHQEANTATLVADTLKKYGYKVLNIAGTGVAAVLDSEKPGRTVALRADMDALPIQEETQLPY